MSKILIIITVIIFCTGTFTHAQKIISDCTIQYSVSSSDSEAPAIGSKIIYIKGKDMRVDLVTKTFSQTIFYNSISGNAAVLKNIGDSKFIAQYNADEWLKANSIYSGLTVTLTDTTKTVLGYNCRQAILTLKNAKTYIVFYTPDLVPSITESPFDTKNIPGLVLEYQSTLKNDENILYTTQKIDFKPVPAHQFDVPQTGYRVLH